MSDMRVGTMTGMMPTRLPAGTRPRLMRLAQRTVEVCSKHGAPLLAQVGDALCLALCDLAAVELRMRNAERGLVVARAKIAELERYIESRARTEFEEPTVTRDMNPLLISGCREPPR